MTILNRYPYLFNYPIAINSENALRQYTNSTRMIRYLKLSVVTIFTLIVLFTIVRLPAGPQNRMVVSDFDPALIWIPSSISSGVPLRTSRKKNYSAGSPVNEKSRKHKPSSSVR
jgi:hypothetical protein